MGVDLKIEYLITQLSEVVDSMGAVVDCPREYIFEENSRLLVVSRIVTMLIQYGIVVIMLNGIWPDW